MKNPSSLLLALLVLSGISFVGSGCNNDDDVDCANFDFSTCNTIEPTEGSLSLKLTINSENPTVPVVVFRGEVEDKDTVFSDWVSEDRVEYYLPVGQYYSVAAYYRKGPNQIRAIDGGKITTSSETKCGYTCWSVSGASLNLRLLGE